ncbi:MAG TPA: IMP cyclohydrolase [Candidatus Scatomorpha intestinavium]|uniref:IMP cyclohydrolase n=1 Tax=Candidatus Scatomorpha intestinavium TaxID=2840922 RepID=A0A9D0ZE16_9FIRM|nr:IMP cyclohydrolase [Candidatus Scatomorpha intestinavium]
MTDLFAYLSERPYPGRGIMIGAAPSGKSAVAYFIMGRSENSRNRVFEKTPDGIRTKAYDESRMTDPSLIIYHPVRRVGRGLVVTNGDQTDTLRDNMAIGRTFAASLRMRTFEPDGPNWTPRISGLLNPDRSYKLSILKAGTPEGGPCLRFFYEYEKAVPGVGHFISTYEGFGSPLPSFSGEPVPVEVPELGARELADRLWAALDAENRVSLYVCVDGEEVIINKYEEAAK